MSVPNDVAATGSVTAPDDSAVAGSPKAQRIIKGIGVVLGALWLIAALVVMLGVVPPETVQAYWLGSEQGTLWVQLMLYPFVTFSTGSLLFNLVWLAGLVRVARLHLTPAAFVRVYSLGTIGVGVIHWLLSGYLTGGQRDLIGSYLALFTVHGALAVLAPRESLFERGRWYEHTDQEPAMSPFLMFGYVVCVLIDSRLWFLRGPGAAGYFLLVDVVGYVVPTLIVLRLAARVRLWWWVVLLFLSDQWYGVWLKITDLLWGIGVVDFYSFAVFTLSGAAALGVGLLYGWAERLHAGREARMRAA